MYVHVDYAKMVNDGRSASGAAVMCGGVCVCWTPTTPRCVSSTNYGSRIRSLWGWNKGGTVCLCGFRIPAEPHLRGKPIVVFEDHEGAKALAENPLSSARSRHIDVRYHYIRGLVRCGKVKLNFVS